MLGDHPEVNIVNGLKQRALHCLERQVVCLAYRVAVMPVNQQVVPEHQGITTPLRQKTVSGQLTTPLR